MTDTRPVGVALPCMVMPEAIGVPIVSAGVLLVIATVLFVDRRLRWKAERENQDPVVERRSTKDHLRRIVLSTAPIEAVAVICAIGLIPIERVQLGPKDCTYWRTIYVHDLLLPQAVKDYFDPPPALLKPES